MIEKCWSQDPNDRLSFDGIVDLLENDPNFITPDINQSEYHEYIKMIQSSGNSQQEKQESKLK